MNYHLPISSFKHPQNVGQMWGKSIFGGNMSSKKYPTKFPGVRYRLHPTRKHNNNKLDQYFTIRYRVNGKLKEEGIGWASHGWNATRASRILSELKESHRTGDGPQTLAEKREIQKDKRDRKEAEKVRIAKETFTFSEYFDKNYYPEAKINKGWRSYKREKSLFELWIKPVIGNMPFKNIRPFNLERIKKNMSDAGKAPRSIQYALAVVRQVFNHATKNETYSGENPARMVTKPKFDNRRMRFLTHREADDLLNNLKARSKQLHDLALLALHCGLRAGEIFDLTWGCVDLDTDRLLIIDTKSAKNRTVYMTNEVNDMFQGRKPGKPTELVFKDRKGNRIKEVSNSFRRAIDKLGLNKGITDPRLKVYFHSLRHTYASWLVQNGINLYTVKELLGHSTLAMTERYSHLAKDTLKNAVLILEKSIDKKNQTYNGIHKENNRR